MGTLQAKCRRGVQPDGLRKEPVTLLGVTHPNFVDDRRPDRPYVAELRVPAIHVPATAIQRAVEQPVVDPGVILLANREVDAVVLVQVIVQPSKIPVNRGGIDMRQVEGICALVLERSSRACSYPLRCGWP